MKKKIGFQGSAHSQGPQGPQGAQGFVGSYESNNPIALIGPTGPQGTNYSPNYSPNSWNRSTGPVGSTGPIGTIGSVKSKYYLVNVKINPKKDQFNIYTISFTIATIFDSRIDIQLFNQTRDIIDSETAQEIVEPYHDYMWFDKISTVARDIVDMTGETGVVVIEKLKNTYMNFNEKWGIISFKEILHLHNVKDLISYEQAVDAIREIIVESIHES
jgi:hypothetical protein